jgi:hypothetical protein
MNRSLRTGSTAQGLFPCSRTNDSSCPQLRVDLFVVCKHCDELINAGLARLRLLGGLDSVTDRVAIELVERFKELFGLWVFL